LRYYPCFDIDLHCDYILFSPEITGVVLVQYNICRNNIVAGYPASTRHCGSAREREELVNTWGEKNAVTLKNVTAGICQLQKSKNSGTVTKCFVVICIQEQINNFALEKWR